MHLKHNKGRIKQTQPCRKRHQHQTVYPQDQKRGKFHAQFDNELHPAVKNAKFQMCRLR